MIGPASCCSNIGSESCIDEEGDRLATLLCSFWLGFYAHRFSNFVARFTLLIRNAPVSFACCLDREKMAFCRCGEACTRSKALLVMK